MKFSKHSLFVLTLVAILATSCAGAGEPPTETPDINASLTAGVSTFAAAFMQTQTAMVTPATETPSPSPSPTMTPITPMTPSASPTIVYFYTVAASTATRTPTPTGTYYTSTASPVGYGCNNLQLIRTDGPTTPMAVGSTFTMEWKVWNTGTCEWNWRYQLVSVSGNNMNGIPQAHNPIPGGNTTTLRVSMTAPSTAGTYTGTWQMNDGAGHNFGSLLTVTIDVRASYP